MATEKKSTKQKTIRKKWSEKQGREVWGYDARIEGRRVRVYGFSTPDAAKVALAKARSLAYDRKHGVAPPPPEAKPKVTVKQLVERRSAQLQKTKSQKKSARLLERWLETLPHGLLVTDLTTAILQDWVDARRADVTDETIFRELTDICSCVNRAGEIFSDLKDWHPPKRPRMKTPTKRRERLIGKEEAAVILAALRRPQGEGETERYWRVRNDAADLLQIALFTSARRQEIFNLRWTDVSFDQMTLRVIDIKNGKLKIIPMTDGLAALLRRRRLAAGRRPLVFPVLAGKTMLAANTDQIYRATVPITGIPYGRDVAGGWVLHDARHTAITAMLDAGYSLESVRRISGHSARVIAMRYAHATDATVRAAVSALDQFGADQVSAFLPTPPDTDVTHVTSVTARPRGKPGKSNKNSKRVVKTRAARG